MWTYNEQIDFLVFYFINIIVNFVHRIFFVLILVSKDKYHNSLRNNC